MSRDQFRPLVVGFHEPESPSHHQEPPRSMSLPSDW